jgi:hypothetical protein
LHNPIEKFPITYPFGQSIIGQLVTDGEPIPDLFFEPFAMDKISKIPKTYFNSETHSLFIMAYQSTPNLFQVALIPWMVCISIQEATHFWPMNL